MKTAKSVITNDKGATIVYVALILGLLLMFAALGIDVNHLYGVRNELQDAADAGALAGARELFVQEGANAGQLDRDAALAEAKKAAEANKSGTQFLKTNTIETGHWSFTQKKFTASTATTQGTWQEVPFAVLDTDNSFINAVRVQADRADTPSFFAKMLKFANFFVSADAVAYIGFAGTLYPGEIDKPIAICKDAIIQNDAYSCNVGRMLNSGGNASTSQTAMWTNYTQDPCSTASSNDMQGLTKDCSASNPNTLTFGQGMGTQNGVQDNVLGNVTDCWLKEADSDGDGVPDMPWELLLPVVDCDVSNTCAPLVGAVKVNVVWIQYKNDPTSQMKDVPTKMGDWTCTTTATRDERFACWKDFVKEFNLQNLNGPPVTDADYEAMYQKKNIYFLPDCTPYEPTGNTGGQNFGILAKIPKLVE
jgi:Flp pilus assembly protein TadG